MVKVAIISGVTGQDGAYLSKLLIRNGYQVIGLTRSNSFRRASLDYLGVGEHVTIEECDLLDFSSIIKLFLKYNPTEFYNLSAQSSVGLSFEQPIGTLNYNTASVLNVLESIRILKLKTKFYQASSSEMFGKVEQLPVNSSTPMHPLSPYAISKASAYWIVANYRESYGLFAVNGILFNHESYLRHTNFFVKKVIRTACEIKLGRASVLKVGNIDIKRDFGYAPEYVNAMYLSLQADVADDYIICSGRSIYLREIIMHVFKKLDVDESCLIEDKALLRPTDINNIYGDNSKAKSKLKWNYDLSFFDVLDLLVEEEMSNLLAN